MQHVAEIEHAGHAVRSGLVHDDIGRIEIVVDDLCPQARQDRQDLRLRVASLPSPRARAERGSAMSGTKACKRRQLPQIPENVAGRGGWVEESAQRPPQPRQKGAERASCAGERGACMRILPGKIGQQSHGPWQARRPSVRPRTARRGPGSTAGTASAGSTIAMWRSAMVWKLVTARGSSGMGDLQHEIAAVPRRAPGNCGRVRSARPQAPRRSP